MQKHPARALATSSHSIPCPPCLCGLLQVRACVCVLQVSACEPFVCLLRYLVSMQAAGCKLQVQPRVGQDGGKQPFHLPQEVCPRAASGRTRANNKSIVCVYDDPCLAVRIDMLVLNDHVCVCLCVMLERKSCISKVFVKFFS